MEVARIVRCIGAAVLAVSLQAGAQPPEGNGRAEHAGASPFIRFPVPQHSVGLAMRSFSKSQGDGPSGPVKAKAAKLDGVVLPATAAPAAREKRAALPGCGAR